MLGNGIAIGKSAGALAWWDQSAFAHWRSDKGITLNGSDVSSWLAGGDVYDLVQSTPADQPAYSASDANFNSNPSLTADGVSEVLREVAGAGTVGRDVGGGDDQPWTVIVAMKMTATGGTDVIWDMAQASSGNYYHAILSSGGEIPYHERRDTAASQQVGLASTGTVTHILTMMFHGTTVSSWIDNVLDINGAALDRVDFGTNTDRAALFARARSSSFNFADMSCCEVRVYDSALADTPRQAAQQSMADYAGVTL